MGRIKVAIDGPAGAGKSTIARLLAKSVGYRYVDTGAMYRASTLIVLRNGIDPEDELKIWTVLDNHKIIQDGERTFIDDEDVSIEIRAKEINDFVSIVCRHRSVRDRMVANQREIAKSGGVIMDGRDIGTVVLPDAELKIFLIASPHERARRRLLDMQKLGIIQSFDEVLENILSRDRLDSTREFAPLCKADDAIVIDNTDMSIGDELDLMKNLVREKEQNRN